MQAVFYTIIALFAIKLAVDWVLDYLNYRYLCENGDTIPQEFAGHIDQDLLSKTSLYTSAKMKFGFVESIFETALWCVFLFGGILTAYASWIASWDLPFVVAGLVFFLILTNIKTLIDMPWGLYSSFVIENRFGFNTMTARLWFRDAALGLVVSNILMLIILSGSFCLIQFLPNFWWLAVWLFFLGISLFLMYVSPYVLEPLFNKFTPIEDKELEQEIKDMVAKAGIQVSNVYQMDASKRTKHSNAYFTGIGHVKRIVLYDTLLKNLSREEILSVLAHEAGHCKKKHIIKYLIVFEIMAFIGIWVGSLLLKTNLINQVFGMEEDNFFAKLIYLSFVASIVMVPLSPIVNVVSRIFEREADDFACNLVGTGDHLAMAMVKLTKDNLSNLHPHPWYAWFHYSHPPARVRIAYLRTWNAMDEAKSED